MEPLAAVGLASAIITFVEFSYKLATGTLDLIKNGTTVETKHSKVVTDDLVKVTDALKTDFLGTSEHEMALSELADKCKLLSGRLQTMLSKLTVPPKSNWGTAVRVSFRRVFKGSDIDAVKSQLNEYRTEIITRISLILREGQIQTRVEIANLGARLDSKSDALLVQLKTLQHDLSDYGKNSTHWYTEARSKFTALQTSLNDILDCNLPATPETRVLRQLYFSSMFSREDSISEPNCNTFDWILQDCKNSDQDIYGKKLQSCSSRGPSNYENQKLEQQLSEELQKSREGQIEAQSKLLQWLSTQNGVLHLSGKPGSGKSTLMKLIGGHPKTKQQLEAWAGTNQLIFAQFFAWRIGDDLQKSLYGLYKSILFTILVRFQNLIRVIFPEAYDTFLASKSENHIDEPLFRLPELHRALEQLTSSCLGNGVSLCLLIDGLDEFKDDPAQNNTHSRLVETLKRWAQNENVKVLVSSRPEQAFTNIVPEGLRIHLHHLTKPDMMTMAKAMLEAPDIFDRVKGYYVELTRRIVLGAEGVFIWFLLMMKTIRPMIEAGEGPDALYKPLKSNLSLDDLYNQLLGSVDKMHQDRIYNMMFIVASYGGHCPLKAMALVDLILDPDFPTGDPVILEEGQRGWMKLGKFRVQQTKGILEVSPSRKWEQPTGVEFFHRTAYETFRNSRRTGDMSTKYPYMNSHYINRKLFLAGLWTAKRYRTKIPSQLKFDKTLGVDKMSVGERHMFLANIEKAGSFYDTNSLRPPFEGAYVDITDERFLIYPIINRYHDKHVSYLHCFSQYHDCEKYVISQLKKAPERMHTDGELSLLLSASLGLNLALVDYLLNNAVSPHEQVELRTGEKVSVCLLVYFYIFRRICYRMPFHSVELLRVDIFYKNGLPLIRKFLDINGIGSKIFVLFRKRIPYSEITKYMGPVWQIAWAPEPTYCQNSSWLECDSSDGDGATNPPKNVTLIHSFTIEEVLNCFGAYTKPESLPPNPTIDDDGTIQDDTCAHDSAECAASTTQRAIGYFWGIACYIWSFLVVRSLSVMFCEQFGMRKCIEIFISGTFGVESPDVRTTPPSPTERIDLPARTVKLVQKTVRANELDPKVILNDHRICGMMEGGKILSLREASSNFRLY